ncbi:hypothetical protein BC830DRAFT_859958 [Chytriomyces sp. MP71]|nr:hypothetical protein BC830DRAFT_859958 [Chytriomyces sp. MP71]
MDLDARYLRTAAFVGVQRGLHGTTAFDCAASLTSIAANSGTPTGSHDDITCLPYESETNVPLCGKTRATEDDTTDALKGLPREAKDASTESEAGLLRGKDTGATNGTVEWAQSGSGSMPPKRLTSVGRKGSRKGSFSRSAAPVKTTGQEASASETEGSPWTQRRSPGSDGSKQGSIPRSLSKKSGINAPEAAQQQDPSFASMRVKSFESAKSASVKVSFDHVESAETDPELTRRRSPKMDPSVRLSSTKRGQVGSSAVSDTDSDSLGASSRFDSIKPEVLEIRKREWTLDKAKTEAKLQKGGFSSTPVIAQLPGPPANASEESLGGRSSRSSRINVNAAGALPSIKEGVILPTTPKTTTHGLTAASRRMSDNKLVKTGLEISSLRASVVKSNKSSLNSCTSSNNGSDEKIHLAGLAKASHRDSDVKLHKQSTIKSISSALSFNISEADPYHQRLAQIYDRVGALDPINREIVDAATSISLGLAPTRTIRKNNVSLRKATHLQSRASIASNASSHVGPSRLNSLSRAMSMASAADFTDESFDVLQQVLVGYFQAPFGGAEQLCAVLHQPQGHQMD